jgi:hypothetical protein
LDGARAADLVQRVEAAVGAAGAQAAGKSLRRVSKLRTSEVTDRWAEIRVVEDVEEFRPEAEAHFLCNTKLPLNGKVGLKRSEAAQLEAPIAKSTVELTGIGKALDRRIPPTLIFSE